MGKLGSIDFKGESGKLYTFNVYTLDSSFSQKGGVYVVTNRSVTSDNSGKHRKIFIGSMSDLSRGFNNHPRLDYFEQEGANCVCVYPEDKDNMRHEIEEDLIKKHHPAVNEMLA